MHDFTKPSPLPRVLGAVGLAAVVVILLAFTLSTVVQAFRGPRIVTEQQLLAAGPPGWWDNYVSYTPPRRATDTGVRYGKKGNEGTKFVLLPVGDKVLFCSARIAESGPVYVGRLESIGGTEEEAIRKGNVTGNRLPFMLQAVRSIWVDTVAVLVIGVGCIAGAIGLLVSAMMIGGTARPNHKRAEPDDEWQDRPY